MPMNFRSMNLVSLCLATALLVGCGSEKPASRADRPQGVAADSAILVITARGERRSFGPIIEAVGTALARESVEITSKSANTVAAIRFAEGQRVAAGTILVELDRTQAAAALAEAEAALAESRNQAQRGRDLSVTQALSKAQLDQLETGLKTAEARVTAARARLDDTVIRAPFAGRTGFRRVSLGGLVAPGAVITTLDDTSIVKLEFTIPQGFLKDIAPGLPVEAHVEGLDDRRFEGRITTLGSRVDPVSRSIAVRAELPNPDGILRPGLFMSVRLQAAAVPTLMIPEAALVPEQGRTYVFVVEDGRAQRREVRIGGREKGSVAILAGIADDAELIVEGTQRARPGAPVKTQLRR